MAMTAWSAKVVTSSICLSVNGRTSDRHIANTPMSTCSRSIGTPTRVRMIAMPGASAFLWRQSASA